MKNMMKTKNSLATFAEILNSATIVILAVAVSTLIIGCGGGGASSAANVSPADSAVGRFLADHEGGGFVGSWGYGGGFPVAPNARLYTITPISNASSLSVNFAYRSLINGTWEIAAYPLQGYVLNSTGWSASEEGISYTDSGDGIHISIKPLEGVASIATITRTSLSRMIVLCPMGSGPPVCAVPGSYPDGAAKYQLDYEPFVSDGYSLLSNDLVMPITDEIGGALSALPAVGTTFCDPNHSIVYRAIIPTPAAGADNYNVHLTPDCTAAQISQSSAYSIQTTVLLTEQMTGNAIVPSVLRLRTPVNSSAPWLNNAIFGLRDGKVWGGYLTLAGTSHVASVLYNKAALNAELSARGWAELQ